MATYSYTGTANADTIQINRISSQPSNGATVYNINGGLGNDILPLNNTGSGNANGIFPSAKFTIAPVNASGVIVVSGASSGGTSFTFNLTSVETIVFSDGVTKTLSYTAVDTTPPTLAITSNKSALIAGQTATISFTFSEDPGLTFTAADITTTGGILSGLSSTGLVRTATFTPTASLNAGAASITVASGSYTDAAGNGGGAGTTPSITFDTLAPTVAITSNKSALKIGEAATITFTFSEDPGTSFIASDITTTGGILSGLTTTGLVRTATFTPTANLNAGAASITVASGSYTDAAGNSGGAGSTPSVSIDTLAPTVAITSNKSALIAGQTATITFTFSEDPGTSFIASDITTTGGILSGLTTTGLVRTATFTPTANLNAGAASIAIASGSYTDAALNAGGAGTTPSITFDTLAPTVAITSSASTLSAGQAATISFTFSEDPGSTFTAADIVTTGGTLSGLTATGSVRTATFTPTVTSGTATVTVTNASYTDAAGNSGSAGTTPSIAISSISALHISADTGISATDFITQTAAQTITATLGSALGSGETLYGSVNNGAAWSNITSKVSGSAITWDGATLSGSSTIKLEVRNGAGAVVSSASQAYVLDTLAPTVAISSGTGALKSGETAAISFTFSEDPGSSFTSTDITTANGTLGALSGTGLVRTATFTPSTGLASGAASITVANASYTDAAGNTGSAGTTPSITIDTLAPTVAISSSTAALKSGETAAISFTFSENPGSSFTSADISLANGTLGALSGSGLVRTATFTPTAGIASGAASITVANASYTDPAGNTGSAGTTPLIIIDTLAPTVAISSSSSTLSIGQTALINFTFSEDPGTSFTSADISLANGTLGALSGSGLVRTATFTPTAGVASGAASITVANASYTDPAGNTGSAGTTPAISIDTFAPSVAITSDKSTIHAGETATISFTFTEDPGSSFTGSDIAIAGGSLGSLSGSGLVHTAIFTPTAGVASAAASITVGNLSYTDPAGNAGSAGTTPALTIKTLAPTTTITGLHISADTGSSATDFITQTAAQTITGSLSAGLGAGDTLYGSVDGTTWSDITSKVSGSAITWDGVTLLLDGSHIIQLEVRNTDGNAGTVASHSYVVDNLAPTVASFAPADAATGVAVGSNIVLNFSETIQKGTGLIVIHSDTETGAVVASYDAATSANISISGSTLTINPTADLTPGTHYYITLPDGSIEDLAGNHFIGTSTHYDFTTASAITGGVDPFAASSGGGGGAGVALAGIGALGLLAFVVF